MVHRQLPGGARTKQDTLASLAGLYVIIDPTLTADRDPLEVARQALQGGATAIQFRDKVSDKGDALPLVMQLARLCHSFGAVCIINDHADLAVAASAHGVHLGQHDLPVDLARNVLKPWQIAGTSNALVGEVLESVADGADYVAVGAMFPTGSKSNTRPAGPETLRKVRAQLGADGPPLIAIGGISQENVAEVAKAGADGICVISAVTLADNPAQAAHDLLTAFRAAHR